MLRKKLLDALGLMRREVVRNDVDLPAPALAGDHLREKRHELLGGVPLSRLSQNLSGFRIQRRIQRERAVPVVLESVTLDSARRQRQDRSETIQSLNRGLFVHAEHRGVLRRIEVQANDVGGLRLELWIVRRHVSLHPVRLYPPSPRPPASEPAEPCGHPRHAAAASGTEIQALHARPSSEKAHLESCLSKRKHHALCFTVTAH